MARSITLSMDVSAHPSMEAGSSGRPNRSIRPTSARSTGSVSSGT